MTKEEWDLILKWAQFGFKQEFRAAQSIEEVEKAAFVMEKFHRFAEEEKDSIT